MGRWDEQHPAVTIRFTPEERDTLSRALEERGATAREALLAWAAAAVAERESRDARDERARLQAQVVALRHRRGRLALRAARDRERTRVRVRHETAALGAEVGHLRTLVRDLEAQVEGSALLLAKAGVAPDDPALGVLVATLMLRPAAEAAGADAVSEAHAFLRAAAQELYAGRPAPTPRTLAASLLRTVRASERAARAELRGRLWGAAVALGARRRARSQGATVSARWYLEHGVVPIEWTRLAQEAARDAGLAVTPESVGLFLRGAADAVRATLADDGPDPEVRPAVDASG